MKTGLSLLEASMKMASNALPAAERTPWKHFAASEFRHAVPSCDPIQMSSSFMDDIEDIRERSGVPMHINSAFRSQAYEVSKGRSGNSYHCVGCALDVACTNSVSRYKLIEAAMHFGKLSMVIHPTYIHFDNRPVHKIILESCR